MRRSPVVLIPGFTGTRLRTLEAPGDQDLWLSLAAMGAGEPRTPGADGPIEPSERWLARMSLEPDGMTPRPAPRGSGPRSGLDAISVLDPAEGQAQPTRYFWNLIAALRETGYGDTDLVAAPYDWRLPPAALENGSGYFGRLARSIERLVDGSPSGASATVIGHSLGNRLIQYFLQMMLTAPGAGRAWIDRYIGRYIAVSALWLGVPKSIREAVTGGDGFGLVKISGLKPVYQTYGSLPWMLPVTPAQYRYLNQRHFAFLGSDTSPLSISAALAMGAPSTRRFAGRFFLDDPHYTGLSEPMGSLAVQPPPVPRLAVLHATGQDTEVGAYYERCEDGLCLDATATSPDESFVVAGGVRYETTQQTRQFIDGTYNSGDGFLPYGSLRYFTTWDGTPCDIQAKAFPGRTHYSILQDQEFLDTVLELLQP